MSFFKQHCFEVKTTVMTSMWIMRPAPLRAADSDDEEWDDEEDWDDEEEWDDEEDEE